MWKYSRNCCILNGKTSRPIDDATAPWVCGIYVYDFDDDWRHVIKVEKTEAVSEPRHAWASIVDGGRNCPPEDVGGVWGYLGLLDIQKRGPKNSDEALFLDMLPEGFDPEAFDLEETQAIMEESFG